MKIFILEDNPDVFTPTIEQLKSNKHEVKLVRNLKDAAYLLEVQPGVSYFDKFIFDAALISEEVSHYKKNNKKPDVTMYNDETGFNGLIFLLNNINLFGDKANRPEVIAINTAHKVKDVKKFVMPNKKITFSRVELSYEDKATLSRNHRTNKIRYADNKGNVYTFSYLDKTDNKPLSAIENFIKNG